MKGHSRAMFQRAIISKLIKTLFCVTLLMSLVLYPPSSAHAHSAAHGVGVVQNADTGHHAGHGAHGHGADAHHDMGHAQANTDSATSSDAPNCCQGICMAAVIAQSPSDLPNVQRASHQATGLSSFSPFDPVEHRRPPKHLI
jgi:hypothetical protein